MANSNEVIIKDGRFIRRVISEQDLGAQDHILASLVESQNIMLPNFTNFGGSPVHLLTNGNKMLMCTELSKLPFKAFVKPNASEPLTLLDLCFHPVRGAISFEESWAMQKDYGKLLFAIYMTRPAGGTWTVGAAHLLIYRNKNLYSPPYPNVYDNSTICMGPQWSNDVRDNSSKKDIMVNLAEAVTAFMSTNMNGDLTCELTEDMFVRNADGWLYPSGNDLQRILERRPVSLNYMQGFAL